MGVSILKFFAAAVMFGSSTLVTAFPANLTERATMATVYTKCLVPHTVALTFDDGPYSYSKIIVDKLDAAGAKGTFFVNGNNYQCIYTSTNADRLLYAHLKGHQIASHTWAHKDLVTLSKPQIVTEMKKVDEALVKIIGARPAWVRPPYGNVNNAVKEAAAERGQSIALWDFDSGDSTGSSPAMSKRAYTELANRGPSSVLTLNHETREGTAKEVLDHALKVLGAKGYQFVTVAECLGMAPYISVVPPQSRDSTWKC